MRRLIIPILIGFVAVPASVQGQTYKDKPPVVIDTAEDYYEEYVNRVFTSDAYDADIELRHEDASYTGHNINITGSCGSAIEGYTGKYIKLTADEGKWNIISMVGDISGGGAIALYSMSQTSTISNTQVNVVSINHAVGIRVEVSELVLDNVEVSASGGEIAGNLGLNVGEGGIITNAGKRGVTITTDLSVAGSVVLSTYDGGTIDLHDATITAVGKNDFSAVLSGNKSDEQNGTNNISLTKSSISSENGSNIIGDISGELNVNLNNVNLSDAKDQNIMVDVSLGGNMYDAVLNLTLSNKTAFDGYASAVGSSEHIAASNIVISSGASWNVTRDSTLGSGSLSLGADDSFISFVSEEGPDSFSDDFTNINAASVMLAEGSFLKLDKNASVFEVGDIITLFTGAEGDAFTNNGALMVTLDGQYIDYIDHDNGTFEIRGIIPSIPEPSTAALGLAALGLLALRRRK